MLPLLTPVVRPDGDLTTSRPAIFPSVGSPGGRRNREGELMAGQGSASEGGRGGRARVSDLVVEFPVGRGQKVNAVSGIDWTSGGGDPGHARGVGVRQVDAGRAMMQLPPPPAGSVKFVGRRADRLPERQLSA